MCRLHGACGTEQGTTARRARVAISGLVCGVLLCCAAIATVGDSRAVALVDEVDGLELNAYLTPNDVEEFKKVSSRAFAWQLRRRMRKCDQVDCYREAGLWLARHSQLM